MKKKLVLFDFDGTLTRKDTMIEFIIFARGRGAYWGGLIMLAPTLIGYLLKLVPNTVAKQKLLAYHFSGMEESVLRKKGADFCKLRLPQLFRDIALEKLHFHRSKGHEVWIITASLDIWVEPWARGQGIPLIATLAEWSAGRFTGGFATPNCHGTEKVNRIQQVINRENFEKVYAYGDSNGDKAMLEYADTAFYRRFV